MITSVQSKLKSLGHEVHTVASPSKPRRTQVISNYAHPVRPPWVSFTKLIWRAAEWTTRHHVYHAPLLRRGALILADRFYFDELLLDPVKYRFSGSSRMVKAVRNLVPHPFHYILLDAPPEVLYSRKQEAPYADVERLHLAYRQWLAQHPRADRVNAALPLESVVDETLQIILRG